MSEFRDAIAAVYAAESVRRDTLASPHIAAADAVLAMPEMAGIRQALREALAEDPLFANLLSDSVLRWVDPP